jgi:hypothetical protein
MKRITPGTIHDDGQLIGALAEKLDLLGIGYRRLSRQDGTPVLEVSDGSVAMPEHFRAVAAYLNEFAIVGVDENCRRLTLHETVAWIASREVGFSNRRRFGSRLSGQ